MKESKIEVVKHYSDIKAESEKPKKKRNSVLNSRGNMVTPRKHHMTDEQMSKTSLKFKTEVKDVSSEIKRKAGTKFFNPYRRSGIYYGCIQSLYLLGCNEWHEYKDVYNTIYEVLNTTFDSRGKNCWKKFTSRSARSNINAKDDEGRIKHNYRTLQRLGGTNPFGYKLKQVCSSVHVKREADGKFYYMLKTDWKNMDEAKPGFDFSAYDKTEVIKASVFSPPKKEEE